MKFQIGIVFFFAIPIWTLEFTRYQFKIPEEKKPFLESLLLLLDKKEYYNHPKWLKLIHYEITISGWESQVDSLDFFLSRFDPKKNFPEGKKNPRIEWLATIESFFIEETWFNNKELHPICAFPARRKFIEEILKTFSIDLEKELPPVDCKNYQLFFNEFKAKSLSLVFASYYLGAPASIFGHTFIKINSYERDEILDYSINYAANPEDLDPFRYAIYGLFGGYYGYYSVMPYYIKIKEYNDIESRDLWEYELDLKEDQIDWILKHNWELANFSYSDYFFATENCSYKLLVLLQVGLENINYIEDLKGFVIPSETVKKIKEQNLIKKRIYRPSIKSQILQRYSLMNEYEKKYFELILQKHLLPMEIQKKNFNFLFVYDTSLLYFKYKKIQSKLDSKEEEFYEQLLLERTQYPIDEHMYKFHSPSGPPEESHEPSQIRIEYGTIQKLNSTSFLIDLNWRYLYHDFFNREWGLPKNSELENFYFNFRYESKEKKIYLEQFKLMNLYSLNPINFLFFLFSYHVEIGYKNLYQEAKPFSLINFLLYRNIFDEVQSFYLITFKKEPYFIKDLKIYSMSYWISTGGLTFELKNLNFSVLGGMEINQKNFSPILENLYLYKYKGVHLVIKLIYNAKEEQFFNSMGVGYNEFKNFEIRLLYEFQKFTQIYKFSISYLF
ncbi:MAG: DUF4105 domain-containing protein [Leptonema sp. (in: bacteria)]